MADASQWLTSIPDIPTSDTAIPYRILETLVEGQLVSSINMKPYIYTELLMTIVDLQQHFFPLKSTVRCRQALDALNIELYKPNRTQMRVLLENGKCTANEVPPLVPVRDVMQFMAQLKYIISCFPES